jgi:hypothetical protein
MGHDLHPDPKLGQIRRLRRTSPGATCPTAYSLSLDEMVAALGLLAALRGRRAHEAARSLAALVGSSRTLLPVAEVLVRWSTEKRWRGSKTSMPPRSRPALLGRRGATSPLDLGCEFGFYCGRHGAEARELLERTMLKARAAPCVGFPAGGQMSRSSGGLRRRPSPSRGVGGPRPPGESGAPEHPASSRRLA